MSKSDIKVIHISDQYQYLSNCPPTPPLTQRWVRGGVGGHISNFIDSTAIAISRLCLSFKVKI